MITIENGQVKINWEFLKFKPFAVILFDLVLQNNEIGE